MTHKQPKTLHDTVREGVVDSVKVAGHVFNGVLDALDQTLPEALRHADDAYMPLSEMIYAVTEAVAEGVSGVGGNLEEAAQALMIGVLRAGAETHTTMLYALRMSAGVFIQKTARLSGDVGAVAKALVAGAVEGAKETGLNLEEIARETAEGAAEAAGESTEAGQKVREALAGNILDVETGIRRSLKTKRSRL